MFKKTFGEVMKNSITAHAQYSGKTKAKRDKGCVFWLEDAKGHIEETKITVKKELLTLITNCDS